MEAHTWRRLFALLPMGSDVQHGSWPPGAVLHPRRPHLIPALEASRGLAGSDSKNKH